MLLPQDQAKLVSLIRYFSSGNFQSFQRLSQLLLPASGIDSLKTANLLLAVQTAGLCEIGTRNGMLHWWGAISDEEEIAIGPNKLVGLNSRWFDDHPDNRVLISSRDDGALLYGITSPFGSEGNFFVEIDRILPSFAIAHTALCKQASTADIWEGDAEVFDVISSSWRGLRPHDSVGKSVVRVRGPFRATSHYIVHEDLGVCFLVLQPEWVFLVAFALLPWEPSQLLKVDGDVVSFARVCRLPCVLYRAILGSAESFEIGPQLIFRGVSSRCIEGLHRYLNQVR